MSSKVHGRKGIKKCIDRLVHSRVTADTAVDIEFLQYCLDTGQYHLASTVVDFYYTKHKNHARIHRAKQKFSGAGYVY